MYLVGISPGRVYSPDEFKAGTCPNRGTRGTTQDGKEFILCEVAASQNLTDGRLVTVSAGFVVTIVPAGQGANTEVQQLAVCVATSTASASMFIWAQIWGRTSVICSLSCNPFVQLRPAITGAGSVDDNVISLSTMISGLFLTATSGLQDTLCAAILNYPRFDRESIA